MDIRVLPAGGRLEFKEQIVDVPIATPRGPVVPVSSVVEISEGLAPQEIQRIEELSAITVSVRKPPQEMNRQSASGADFSVLFSWSWGL